MSLPRVGFNELYTTRWMGGVMYLRNLLRAVHSLGEEKKIHTVVFLSKDSEPEVVEMLSEFADEIVFSSRFKHRSLAWSIDEIFFRLMWWSPILSLLLRKHKIDVSSHSHYLRPFFPKTIAWIPDFQHIRLPGMFTKKELDLRSRGFHWLINACDRLVLSSHSALEDFHRFAGKKHDNKVSVLQFVTSPTQLSFSVDFSNDFHQKRNLPKKFFYVPNQFWKHKNHLLVLKAVAILKKMDTAVSVVFTGHMEDYRDRSHVESLRQFVKDEGIESQIYFLGRVSNQEVNYLFLNSLAIINPSFFEGWSTTVEEAKMFQKPILLSGIDVHREQAPSRGVYFDPQSSEELAHCMKKFWESLESGEYFFDEKAFLEVRKRFGHKYQDIVLDLVASI